MPERLPCSATVLTHGHCDHVGLALRAHRDWRIPVRDLARMMVAGAATADSATNLRSLQVLADTGAGIVLPGHGDPWTAGIASAVAQARGHAESDHQTPTARS